MKKLREEIHRLETELLELRRSGAGKDRFLAMLAHELRNPLGALSNALQVMRSTEPSHPAWGRAFQVVERQIQHQVQLLNDLLEVSRLSRGKLETRRERLDLHRLIEAAAGDGRQEAEKAGLAFSLEIPDRPFWIEGDPAQLSQVLSKLLSNAVKFTDAGGQIDVQVTENPPGCIAVAVRDNGIGIEPGMLRQVWEVFSQADRTLERRRGGLGLGLALVYGLIELHGGEVRAESPGLGQGATFTISLPLLPSESEPAADPAEEVRPKPRSDSVLSILVIEDNVDAAETLHDLLDLFGHRVEVAHTGPEGIDTARRIRPDIVLCDIGLPGMDGYAVARQLRQEPSLASARLIALTGYGRDSDRRRAQDAGFDMHLVKPVEPAELKRLLTEQ